MLPQNGRYTPLLCFHLGAGELLSNFHRIDADLIQQHATIVGNFKMHSKSNLSLESRLKLQLKTSAVMTYTYSNPVAWKFFSFWILKQNDNKTRGNENLFLATAFEFVYVLTALILSNKNNLFTSIKFQLSMYFFWTKYFLVLFGKL